MGCCDDLIREINLYIQKADNKLSDELSKKGYKNAEGTVTFMNEIEDKILELFKDNADEVIEELRNSDSVEDFYEKVWPKIKAKSSTSGKMSSFVSSKARKFVPKTAQDYMNSVDSDLNIKVLTKPATSWISSWSSELGEKMKISQIDKLEKLLSSGIENGTPIADLIREIQEAGIRENYTYARSTALTETLTAHNAARQEFMVQCPAVTRKRWLHTGSKNNNPRLNHLDMDGQTVSVNQPFTLPGADGFIYEPMYPCDTILPPGERINCHCIATNIVDDDILGLSLEEREALQAEAIEEYNSEFSE